jgi:hypothetical protein
MVVLVFLFDSGFIGEGVDRSSPDSANKRFGHTQDLSNNNERQQISGLQIEPRAHDQRMDRNSP